MAEKTRRFFLSDIHLGGDNAWFHPDKHKQALFEFLAWVRRQDGVKDLVILGDLFDTWMFPMKSEPESIAQIGQRHRDVLDRIASCSAEKGGSVDNIYYLNGNHDMHVTQEDLDAPELFGPGVVQRIQRYNAGLVYGEHGSRFTMFNASDKLHDPGAGLPLGYFITRMIASSTQTYKTADAMRTYVGDALEAMATTQTLAQSVIEALRERLRLSSSDRFVMPGNHPGPTVAEVQTKYAPLFERWVQKFGYTYSLRSLHSELGSLGWFADRLCKQNGYRVVVLGHSHGDELDADRRWTKDRIYANAGDWCSEGKQTFVEVDKQPKGKLVVRLWKMTRGDAQRASEQALEGK